MALQLNVIIGSTRPGRAGLAIGQWASEFARTNSDFNVELVDLAEFNLPLLDEAAHPRLQKYQHEHTKRWSRSVAAADAYLFIAPEYDYFPNAALVNALQCLSLEWNYKVASTVSYGGISAGLRANQPLRQLFTNLNMMAIPQSAPIPLFSQFLGDNGVFTPNDAIADGLKLVLAELGKWAGALQPLRAK